MELDHSGELFLRKEECDPMHVTCKQKREGRAKSISKNGWVGKYNENPYPV